MRKLLVLLEDLNRKFNTKDFGLINFLARSGGLKDNQELRAVLGGTNPFIPGVGSLIRKAGGMTLDSALRAATDAGYLFDPGEHAIGVLQNDWRDLIELIDKEMRGEKQYRFGHAPQSQTDERDEERSRLDTQIRIELGQAGIEDVNSTTLQRINDLMFYGEETDVVNAYERAVMEEPHTFHNGIYQDYSIQF